MKLSRLLPVLLVLAVLPVPLRADPPPAPGAKAAPIFDGKTLAGWEGNAAIWSVKDGALAGGSLTEQVTRNEFLATEKSYADFDLRLKIKITGAGGFINSGVQIRSVRVPNDSEMSGYQCDAVEGWHGDQEHGDQEPEPVTMIPPVIIDKLLNRLPVQKTGAVVPRGGPFGSAGRGGSLPGAHGRGI